MVTSLLMNLVNIAGNAICIFGLHMGVEGVALPTLIARALGAGMLTVGGQCHGAGEHAQAVGYAKKLLVVNYALLTVICAAMIAGASTWSAYTGFRTGPPRRPCS